MKERIDQIRACGKFWEDFAIRCSAVPAGQAKAINSLRTECYRVLRPTIQFTDVFYGPRYQ